MMALIITLLLVIVVIAACVLQGVHSTCNPLANSCVCQTSYVSAADYNAASLTIRNAIIAQSPTTPNLNRGDIVGLLVRLAFHDSAEYDRQQSNDVYRSDGCIDMTEADNAGLQEGINILQPLWLQHCSVFSRADFWYLAAIVSINKAEPSGNYNIPFNYGRIDAASCTGTAGRLPSAEGGFGELTRVFVNQMGMTTRQAVAVLGAHTLGRAVTANSGYNGGWVPQTAVFDNVFFRDILGVGWRKRAIDNTHHQWDGPPNTNTMMLNTDMSLGFTGADTAANNRFCGGPNPPPQGQTTCPTAANAVEAGLTSFQLIQQYGSNNALFLSDFSSSFLAMTSVGYSNSLVTYSPTMPAPTALPTLIPSRYPTESPSQSFKPTTGSPSESPTATTTPTVTAAPSVAPTFAPSTTAPSSEAPTSEENVVPSSKDDAALNDVSIGLIAGACTVTAASCVGYFFYSKYLKNDYKSVTAAKIQDPNVGFDTNIDGASTEPNDKGVEMNAVEVNTN